MKKVMILFVAVMILTSFLIIAENDNSNSGSNGDSSLSVNASINVGVSNNGGETEQNQNDSSQNQEQNENSLSSTNEYEKKNLTQAQKQKIIQARNRLQMAIGNETCPEKCECEGSTVKCELANGTRILTIHAGNSNNTIIQIKNINASTQVTLFKSDDGKVYGVFRNNETKEIILPDELRDRIRNQTKLRLQNESINLTEDGNYQIEARQRARLFWTIPVKERIQVRGMPNQEGQG